jgi:hypothetical protein
MEIMDRGTVRRQTAIAAVSNLPMGIARTMPPSRHTLTNVAVLKHFMDIACEIRSTDRNRWEIVIY